MSESHTSSSEVGSAGPSEAVEAERRQDQTEPCDTAPPTNRVNENVGPFSIGQNVWPGIAKLAEECGELVQVIGKLIATSGRTDHWSGRDLRIDLEDEMADVRAALAFVWANNDLDKSRMADRVNYKVNLFEEWHGTKP